MMMSPVSRMLLVLLLASLIALNAFAVEVPLVRRTHVRTLLREIYRAKYDFPDDQKLPISEWRQNNDSATTGASSRLSRAVTLPLRGGSLRLGEIFMNVQVGSPPTIYSVQVDTGSSDFGLPSSGCSSCGSTPEIYSPSISTTSSPVSCSGSGSITCPKCDANQCTYTIQYGDGSGYSAHLFTDVVTVSNLRLLRQSVGAIYKEVTPNGPFEPYPVDGIIGLAFSTISETNSPTVMDSLVSTNQVANIFSMCTTGAGGAMELGGILNYYSGAIQWTPLLTPHYFYSVYVNDVQVGGQSLGLSATTYNSGGSIVDSGTTDLLLPQAAYNAFKSRLTNNCRNANLVGVCNVGSKGLFNGYCFKMTAAQLAAFPPLTIVMPGATITIPPQQYIVDGYCGQAGYLALALDPINANMIIMGDTVHRQYEVIYDRINSRMGFAAASNCPAPSS